MFVIYDKNMNRIEYPDGVKPLDIFISSIGKDRITETIEGMNGVVNYGSTYTERTIDLELWLSANDTKDYRLLRNEVYAMFQKGDEFYISEKNDLGKRYHVAVDESFTPERVTHQHSTVDVSCVMVGQPFSESIATTQDIQLPDYAEDIPGRNLIPETPTFWEAGSYWSASGGNSNNDSRIRIRKSDPIKVYQGREYTIHDDSASYSNLNIINVYQYTDGEYLGSTNWFYFDRGGTETFTAAGNEVLIAYQPVDGESIEVSDVSVLDDTLKTKMEIGNEFTGFNKPNENAYGIAFDTEDWAFGMGLDVNPSTHQYTHVAESSTPFEIYNAGNVSIHPFEQYLVIEIDSVEGSTNHFEMRNESNGSNFRINEGVARESHVKVDGPNVEINNLAALRRTNKQYIQLSPGANMISVHGCRSARVSFDFKFYYL